MVRYNDQPGRMVAMAPAPVSRPSFYQDENNGHARLDSAAYKKTFK